MGRLHDRMAEDLRLRNFSPATQRNYLLYARRFAAFFMRSPEELGEAEIRQFLLHQIEVKHLSYQAYRQIYAALKFLYTVTLKRSECLAMREKKEPDAWTTTAPHHARGRPGQPGSEQAHARQRCAVIEKAARSGSL
jgi:hypothetical protein